MVQELSVFSNNEFGSIRAFKDESGEPFFIAKDVCEVLGYKNSRDALKKHVDPEDKGVANRYTLGGEQAINTINESGLYSLILRSRKPEAKAFKRWVTHEVLPAIRRDGAYVYAGGNETTEELLARALKAADEALKRKDEIIAGHEWELSVTRPKAILADAIQAADGTCLVGELAKIMTQAGYKIGQNRLFEKLRNDGYLGKSGCNYNVPLQRYIEQGLFKIKEHVIKHEDGHTTLKRTTKVTGKGQRYFVERYVYNEQKAVRY